MLRNLTFVSALIAANLVDSSVAANNTIPEPEQCEASWYGHGMDLHYVKGHGMVPLKANGQIFDMDDPTVVAHKELPFGTEILVTNLNNGESVELVVQDRGPFARNRCVDLSRAAAKNIGMYCGPGCGTADVLVEVISLPGR